MFKLTVLDENISASKNYRIPSLITTNSGVVVLCADNRVYGGGDNPNRIEKIVRRSFDNGKTWDTPKVIVEEIGQEKMKSSASIDPALLYDNFNNIIFMITSHTPSGVGILNCKLTKGYINDKLVLTQGRKKYVVDNNNITTLKGEKTGYTVDKNGYIYDSAKQQVGNYKVDSLPFSEEKTSFLMLYSSKDDGATWSEPICLNTQVKKNSWGFIGAGPGVGITIQNGKYKGRLIFPIYYGKLKMPPSLECAAMFSDDCGKTWQIGKSPTRVGKFFNPLWLVTPMWLTESQIIELDDTRLMAFIRNHNQRRCIANAYSSDGGMTWQGFHYREELPQPICQISAIKFKYDNKPCVVICNAADKKKRITGVIRLSEDDGVTFPYSRILQEGEFVYSSLTLMQDNNIGIGFEPETEHRKIEFASVSLDWIKGKEN